MNRSGGRSIGADLIRLMVDVQPAADEVTPHQHRRIRWRSPSRLRSGNSAPSCVSTFDAPVQKTQSASPARGLAAPYPVELSLLPQAWLGARQTWSPRAPFRRAAPAGTIVIRPPWLRRVAPRGGFDPQKNASTASVGGSGFHENHSGNRPRIVGRRNLHALAPKRQCALRPMPNWNRASGRMRRRLKFHAVENRHAAALGDVRLSCASKYAPAFIRRRSFTNQSVLTQELVVALRAGRSRVGRLRDLFLHPAGRRRSATSRNLGHPSLPCARAGWQRRERRGRSGCEFVHRTSRSARAAVDAVRAVYARSDGEQSLQPRVQRLKV